MTGFTLDGLAFLLLLLLFPLLLYAIRFKKKWHKPHVSYSNLSNLLESASNRIQLAKIPSRVLFFSLFVLGLAFLDFHVVRSGVKGGDEVIYTEGAALYLVLDRSGSMKRPVMGGSITSFDSRIDMLKRVTEEFVKRRQEDLLGLVTFARGAEIVIPLTQDHDTLLQKLETISVVQKPENDGTAIGYAIYKTASLISAARQFGEELRQKGESVYDIKGGAIVLVTDGFQNPNKADKGNRLRTIGIDEAAHYAQEQNVRLYIVSIDPLINTEEFIPLRDQMERASKETGGNFYTVSIPDDLEKIYLDIDMLEKAKIPPKESYQRGEAIRVFSFYPFFLWVGALGILFFAFLETVLIRRIP